MTQRRTLRSKSYDGEIRSPAFLENPKNEAGGCDYKALCVAYFIKARYI